MPEAGRLGDNSRCAADHHGCPKCAHVVEGPAVEGSNDVLVNGRGAIRVADHGTHAACCGPNRWEAIQGSRSVLINGRRAHRRNDMTAHCGGEGRLQQGSPNVLIGEHSGPAARTVEVSHNIALTVSSTDAHGRKLKNVIIRVICPHKKFEDQEFSEKIRLSGLCEDAAIMIIKQLQHNKWGE